jgi:excisionase family DNA binding protein
MVNNELELKPIAVGIHDAARLIGLSKRTVRRYAKTGRIRTARAGRRVLIPLESLQEFKSSMGGCKSCVMYDSIGFKPLHLYVLDCVEWSL